MGYGELSILQHQIMTEVVKKFPTPQFIGKTMFPEKPIDTDTAKWDETHQNRDMADYVVPDGEGNVVARLGVIQRSSTVACLKEKKQLKGSTMAWLRKPGTDHVQYAEQAVKDELADLDSRLEFRREWARWSALTGTLTIDQTKVKFTVDYGIDATHKPTVGTAWSDVSCDIIGDLTTWKQLIQQDSGEQATTVYCNTIVMNYLVKNTGIKSLMGEQLKTQILQSGYITRVIGLNFVVYDAGYVPASTDTFTKFVDDAHVFMVTSSIFAEEQLAPSTDPKSSYRPGKFSKSWQEDDPAGIWVLVELNSLPVIKKVENIVYADITP